MYTTPNRPPAKTLQVLLLTHIYIKSVYCHADVYINI